MNRCGLTILGFLGRGALQPRGARHMSRHQISPSRSAPPTAPPPPDDTLAGAVQSSLASIGQSSDILGLSGFVGALIALLCAGFIFLLLYGGGELILLLIAMEDHLEHIRRRP